MKRVAFDFTEEFIKELDMIMKKAGLSTRKDLFNEAISFFEFCLDHTTKTGNLPILRDENGEIIQVNGRPFVLAQKEYEKKK